MENQKEDFKELKERIGDFDTERFIGHYETLIHVGIDSGSSTEVMLTLSFLTELKDLLDKIKEAISSDEPKI